MDEEDILHYQLEEKRRIQDFTVQCGLICHTFPQYRLEEVKNMPLNQFNELYILAEQVRNQLVEDIALAVASSKSKYANSELVKRDKKAEKMKRSL